MVKPTPALKTEFANTRNVTSSGADYQDWKDNELKSLGGIKLRVMDETEISNLGKTTLQNIVTNPSEQDAANVILLAWNMSSAHKTLTRIFPPANACTALKDISISTISNTKMLAADETVALTFSGDEHEISCSITYLCASLLRLFTKPGGNYVLAASHIVASYSKFYLSPLAVRGWTPTQTALNTLSDTFRGKAMYLNSLAPLLYHLYDVKDGSNVVRFCFEMHLACTGMHGWSLFLKNIDSSKMTSEEYLSWLDSRKTRPPLLTIKKICDAFEGTTDPDRLRRTWRFARLYRTDAFSSLQTKNCKELVYIQARLAQHLGVMNSGNILQIEVIRGLSDVAKVKLDSVATKFYEAWLETNASGNCFFE